MLIRFEEALCEHKELDAFEREAIKVAQSTRSGENVEAFGWGGSASIRNCQRTAPKALHMPATLLGISSRAIAPKPWSASIIARL